MELALIALSAPAALVGLALFTRSGPRPGNLKRAAGAASAVGLVAALVLGVATALDGPHVSPGLTFEGLGTTLRFDALSVLIFSMIALLAVIILRFSATYLDGEARQGVFVGRLAWTIASVELLVLSGNLALFFAAWVATSLTLHRLLVFHPDRPRAVAAAKKKFIAARIGDVSLLAASGLLYDRFGTGDLGALFQAAAGATADAQVQIATVLIAVAALFKSAQFPTHGWLVEVMETPTPVSALLHAGILNGGPFLVLRFAFLMELGDIASVLLVLVGGFTALFASVVLLTQTSVKVALGYSSAAHMGFMLLVCGLGVYPAAVLHLVAHSFYKAHAFLSSGSVVDQARAKGVVLPARLRSPARALASLALALLVYLVVASSLGYAVDESPALMAVGAMLVMGVAHLLAPALDARGTPGVLLRCAGLALAVTVAFFLLEEGARLLLTSALPEVGDPSVLVMSLALVVLGSFGAALALQVLPLNPASQLRRSAYVHLKNGLYANAAFDRLVGALRAP